MTEYAIFIEAEFRVKAKSLEDTKRRLRRLLRENGFDEKNFEINIIKVSRANMTYITDLAMARQKLDQLQPVMPDISEIPSDNYSRRSVGVPAKQVKEKKRISKTKKGRSVKRR